MNSASAVGRQPHRREIELKIAGRTYSGVFELNGDVVTVTTDFGKKSGQVGWLAPDRVARWLLQQLVTAEMRKPSEGDESRRKQMNGIVYIVGLIVVTGAVLAFFGLR